MPTTPQVTLDFYGSPVRFREIDGELWLTAEEAVIPLGLSGARTVRALFSEHRDDFLEDVEFQQVTPGDDVVFSLAGLDHLALLHSTDANVRARRWTAVLRERRKRGALVAGPESASRALRGEGPPHFAPHDGVCWSCRRQIYEELDGRSFVTGCPFCHRSYCD